MAKDPKRKPSDEESEQPAESEPIPPVIAAATPKPIRGLGYKIDEADHRDFQARALFGARFGVPAEASLEQFVHVPFDQLWTSSCVGHAIGGAIDTRYAKMGRKDAPKSSKLGIYGFSRSLARASASEALVDEGTQPRFAMKGLKMWGVPSEKRWPFDPDKVNAELPWDVLQEASAHVVAAWWRITSFGTERVEDICQAIAKGYPVVFGVGIDRAFLDHVGKGVVGLQNEAELVGGHMMYACAFRTNAAGKREIRCVNSWGTKWGDGGFFWAAEEFFVGAQDVYVIQVA